MYPLQTDTVQINAPEYDSDIDWDNQPNTHNSRVTISVQGTLNTPQESSILQDDNSTALDNITTSQNQQETDWPEAPTIQIPGVLQQHQINQQKSHIIDAKSSLLQQTLKYPS